MLYVCKGIRYMRFSFNLYTIDMTIFQVSCVLFGSIVALGVLNSNLSLSLNIYSTKEPS